MLASEIKKKSMPVILVTMKLLNGLFWKAEATPCCITESETERKDACTRDIAIEAKE